MLDDRYLYKLEKGETFHIVDQDGTAGENLDPRLSDELLLKMYRLMVESRAFDEKALKLQRSGRMGTYPPYSGQEATQIGAALAMQEQDWLVPSYREGATMMAKGIAMKNLFMMWMGNDYGNRIPDNIKCLPIAIPVGSQILHAAGIGWSARLKNEKLAVLAFFGDGATSRGDFHEGLNFASVYNAPVVFLCSNNEFAISTRNPQQTHAETFAQKAIAYGMKGYRLDGMDALAAYVLVKDALDRVRDGESPILIESLCYRFGPHTTSDNPDLYRTKEEVERMIRERDPIARFRNYLMKKGLWDDSKEKSLTEEAGNMMDRIAREAEQAPAPSFEEYAKHTFATVPEYLEEEIEYFKKVQGGKK